MRPVIPPALKNLRGHLMIGAGRLVSLLALDLSAIFLARFILRGMRAGWFGHGLAAVATSLLPAEVVSVTQLAVAIVLTFLFTGRYRAGDLWRDPVRLLSATGAGVVLALYADVWHGPPAVVIGRGMLVWVFLGPLLVAVRGLADLHARWLGSGLRHRVLEVTGDGAGSDVARLGPSYNVLTTLDHSDLPAEIGSMERWLDGGIDTILVRGQVPSARFADLTDFALTHGCRLLCTPRTTRMLGIESKRVWMQGHPLAELTTPGMRASHLVLKRALDIFAASVALVALSPLLLVLAIWVRLDSPGPAIFRQRRPGFCGRSFQMLKFRSMRHDAEDVLRSNPELYDRFLQNDCKLPPEVDPRLTRAGRFLRRTSLDELPQLINVIRGDMSLVGPRPLVGPELENYGSRIPTLLSVKPGITGLWQVSGRSDVQYPERAELDLDYVRNWSFLGDLWILVVTPAAVLLRRGAH